MSGADYIKKIFQVPFGIPRISRNDLRAFFESVVSRADLAEEQRQDLENVVWPHLDAGAAASVNPREVKRLINAYTLQMKLLSAKLEDEEPDPHVVLALQTMSFRPDWRGLYETVTADPDLFVAALRKIADHGGADAWIGREPVPQSFVRYLDAVGRPLFDKPSLDVYLTSAEATRSSDPLLAEAHRAVLELHGGLKQLLAGGDASAAFAAIPGSLEALTRIREFLHDRESQSRLAAEAVSRAKSLESRLKEAHEAGPTADTPPGWLRDADRDLAGLDEILRELRRESHVGGRAVA